MSARGRLLVLAVGVLLLAGVGTGLVVHAASRAAGRDRADPGAPVVREGGVTLGRSGRLFFRSMEPGPHSDEIVSVPAADPGAVRTGSGLRCLRFYAAAGTGICLRADTGLLQSGGRVLILDSALRVRRSLPYSGIPSRARVSPSGHLVAWTVFVSGDSYAVGAFSTRTSILDTRTGRQAPSLEGFGIELDGRPYHAADANFWGVTFARDDDTFYATLGTRNRTYLVRGSLSRRTVRTLAENVECPSLSPDGTRIAFKKRVLPGASLWHEYVLDLRTLRETPLAERRSVDDQAEWLDDATIAYALPGQGTTDRTDLWAVPADGRGAPRLLARGGASPSLLR
ncbi:TolB family protein [Phaeacidiphilus oryzae]|uniref:TolB family protein n=1 Tax=Phaeacidiphilus oryzae TaxID=348818 RepID=UPI00055F00BD|nr:hypothetical protein [Phaeacidiphilus oryzae]